MLVFAVGNPSRGDDAIGPLLIERLERRIAGEIAAGRVELLTDFQLQVEHVLDLAGRERVYFVDASVAAVAPFSAERIAPREERGVSTHSMSPAALLATYRAVAGEPPESWLVAIAAERFELGEGLSEAAERNLAEALEWIVERLREVSSAG